MTRAMVLTAAFALVSLPMVAQTSPQTSPEGNPAMQRSGPPVAAGHQDSASAGAADTTAAAAPESAMPDLQTVNGELLNRLDTKTAKTGDNVVVQTNDAVKTADGMEIPKGSKLVGHVVAVQPSAAGQNSQVVLKFDHAELAGGQSMPIQSEIEALGSPEGKSAASDTNAAPTAPEASTTTAGAGAAGGWAAAGTVVARNGKIAISTTSIPGILLANNQHGQQDPRMAQASSILLGAKKDVQIEGGTQVVIGVAAGTAK